MRSAECGIKQKMKWVNHQAVSSTQQPETSTQYPVTNDYWLLAIEMLNIQSSIISDQSLRN
ncbi:MAG: hypothetical protein KAT27_01880, partial [Desulfobacterales bacterium]|nr:hypothetical protein [Desulfobacterales bacterium]